MIILVTSENDRENPDWLKSGAPIRPGLMAISSPPQEEEGGSRMHLQQGIILWEALHQILLPVQEFASERLDYIQQAQAS